jgi:hypothetical protein
MHSIHYRENEHNYGSSSGNPTWTRYRDNHPESYEDLTPSQKAILRRWIEAGLPADAGSYFLKHEFEESEEGFYISNGHLKGAMLAAGHVPVDDTAFSWVFRAGGDR